MFQKDGDRVVSCQAVPSTNQTYRRKVHAQARCTESVLFLSSDINFIQVFAPKFTSEWPRTSQTSRCAKQRGIWRKYLHAQELDKPMLYVLGVVKALPAPSSKRPGEQKLVIDSRASMHMMCEKESSEETGTVKRSTNPTVMLTAIDEVHTHEEQKFSFMT